MLTLKKQLANLITMSRIFLIPLLIYLFWKEKFYLTIILFSFAALTDGIDGYIARYLNQTSHLGAWLDPVADKLIVISLFILLLADQKDNVLIFSSIFIVCREVIMSALREWMAVLGKRHSVKASMLGKWKTATQMVTIFLFLLSKLYPYQVVVLTGAYQALYLATLLTLLSLIDYIGSAIKALQK